MNELAKLKQLVLRAKDLKEPLNYLFDLVDDEKLFNLKGQRIIKDITDHSELLVMLGILKGQVYEQLGIPLHDLIPLFYETPKYHFIHGTCSPKELLTPITLMYFSDIKTGIFAVSNEKTNLFRFSLMNLNEIKNLH